jgi:hypothetical protein
MLCGPTLFTIVFVTSVVLSFAAIIVDSIKDGDVTNAR